MMPRLSWPTWRNAINKRCRWVTAWVSKLNLHMLWWHQSRDTPFGDSGPGGHGSPHEDNAGEASAAVDGAHGIRRSYGYRPDTLPRLILLRNKCQCCRRCSPCNVRPSVPPADPVLWSHRGESSSDSQSRSSLVGGASDPPRLG